MRAFAQASLLVGVAALLLGLAGCSAPAFPDPHGERTADDALPSELGNAGYDRSTSLLVGTHDGVDVYLVWPADDAAFQGAPCLALGPPESSAACGGPGLTMVTRSGVKFQLHPPEQVLEDGWVRLSDNVSVLDP